VGFSLGFLSLVYHLVVVTSWVLWAGSSWGLTLGLNWATYVYCFVYLEAHYAFFFLYI
jgi:hypothetical protein